MFDEQSSFRQVDLELDDHRTSNEFLDLANSPEHETGPLETESVKRTGVRPVDSIGGVAGVANPTENGGHHLKTAVSGISAFV